jgi:hypothetical protein
VPRDSHAPSGRGVLCRFRRESPSARATDAPLSPATTMTNESRVSAMFSMRRRRIASFNSIKPRFIRVDNFWAGDRTVLAVRARMVCGCRRPKTVRPRLAGRHICPICPMGPMCRTDRTDGPYGTGPEGPPRTEKGESNRGRQTRLMGVATTIRVIAGAAGNLRSQISDFKSSAAARRCEAIEAMV